MSLKEISVVAVILSLIGCASTSPMTQEIYTEHLTKTYNYSKNECYKATTEAMEELDYEIDKADSDKGKIITKRKSFISQETTTNYSDTLKYTETHDVSVANKYYFLISDNGSSSCTVEVERFRIWYKGKELKEMIISYVNEHQWQAVFNEINEKLIESM